MPQKPLPDFEIVERVARLLDSKYRIPGTRFRFGLDPLINLVPFLGDIVGFFIQGMLVVYMLRYGASGKVALKMFLNVLFDTFIGGIPVLGQIADFFFKANNRNIKLLKEHYQEGKHQGNAKGIIAGLILLVFVFYGLILFLIYKLIAWLVGYL